MTLYVTLTRLLKSHLPKCVLTQRLASSTSTSAEDPAIVVTNNRTTIVCWHPEPTFPYEFSKPLPPAGAHPAGESVLRAPFTDALDAELQGTQRYRHLFVHRSDKQIREELMKLTGTNKHVWFPHTGTKYRKKNPPRDRKYL